MTDKPYVVAAGDNGKTLAQEVNRYLEKGYVMYGDAVASPDGVLYQPMVKNQDKQLNG